MDVPRVRSGGQILSDLGIQRIRLLSDTPMHIPALEGFGLEIVEQVPIPLGEPAAKIEKCADPHDQLSVIEE